MRLSVLGALTICLGVVVICATVPRPGSRPVPSGDPSGQGPRTPVRDLGVSVPGPGRDLPSPARPVLPRISHLHLRIPLARPASLDFRYEGPGVPVVEAGYFDGQRGTAVVTATREQDSRWHGPLPTLQVDALQRFRITVQNSSIPWQYALAPPMPFPRAPHAPDSRVESELCERYLSTHLKASGPVEEPWGPGPLLLVASRSLPAVKSGIVMGTVPSPLVGQVCGLIVAGAHEEACQLVRTSTPDARLVVPAYVSVRTAQTAASPAGTNDVTICIDYFSDPGEARAYAAAEQARFERALTVPAVAESLRAAWPGDPTFAVGNPSRVRTHVRLGLWYAGSPRSLWMPIDSLR